MATSNGLAVPRRRTCEHCGKPFPAPRASSRYCSAPCRVAHDRYGRAYGQTERRSIKS